ncbi:hypothetical protein D3OALGA1CA_1737 [Olavius algarvensis associated proteobacterium Delta 3]|nr:hypothetical protein D3OALGA1CA_1737 [Olavius algarvensis associated proteobacterium Delta 3]
MKFSACSKISLYTSFRWTITWLLGLFFSHDSESLKVLLRALLYAVS